MCGGSTGPVNHPQRRVAALSILARSWEPFCRLIEPSSPLDTDRFFSFFRDLSHPYWSFHYTMGSAAAAKELSLVGKARAMDILVNWVLPYRWVPDDKQIWSVFESLSAQQENQKSRRAALRLLGERPDLAELTSKVYQQQALLQIYDDFCLEDDSGCEECPFPEQLRQWF